MNSFEIAASRQYDKYFNFHYFSTLYYDLTFKKCDLNVQNYSILCIAVNVV